MPSKKPRRSKAPAVTYPVETRDDAEAALIRLGEIGREIDRIDTALKETTARANAEAAEALAPLHAERKERLAGLQAWATAHRRELTNNGKRQSCELQAGVIGWRMSPPAVSLRRTQEVIEFLKRGGSRLRRFLRFKIEVDRQALLKEQDVARSIPGVSITQTEEFYVEPRAIGAVKSEAA